MHAGSNYHNAPSPVGWGSYHTEDYVGQSQAFQTQLTSLIVEGVFAKYPKLKVVMLESGFTWLPTYLWRLHKFWRGVRMETPWVDRRAAGDCAQQRAVLAAAGRCPAGPGRC